MISIIIYVLAIAGILYLLSTLRQAAIPLLLVVVAVIALILYGTISTSYGFVELVDDVLQEILEKLDPF